AHNDGKPQDLSVHATNGSGAEHSCGYRPGESSPAAERGAYSALGICTQGSKKQVDFTGMNNSGTCMIEEKTKYNPPFLPRMKRVGTWHLRESAFARRTRARDKSPYLTP